MFGSQSKVSLSTVMEVDVPSCTLSGLDNLGMDPLQENLQESTKKKPNKAADAARMTG